MHSLIPTDNLFKNKFDFTTAGDWDCVAVVERLPALHYSVDFIFLPFGIMGFIENFETVRGSLIRSIWPKLVWPRKCVHSILSSLLHSSFPTDNLFKNIFTYS